MRSALYLVCALTLMGCETHTHFHYWHHQKHHLQIIPQTEVLEEPTRPSDVEPLYN